MKPIFTLTLAITLLSLACVGPAVPPPPVETATDPSANVADVINGLSSGQAIYEANCQACHSLNADQTAPGPSIAGIASRSMDTIADADYKGEAASAEAYITESIMAPNVYVVPGYAANIMVSYEDRLTAQEIEAVVTYLLTLD